MVQGQQSESERVTTALATGQLSVADEHGFHHHLYAICPQDGIHIAPERVVWRRDADGRRIDHLMFRCPSCGRAWQAELTELHLS